jgi:hypothetical protein
MLFNFSVMQMTAQTLRVLLRSSEIEFGVEIFCVQQLSLEGGDHAHATIG